MPEVSIVMSVRNSESYISQAVESVLLQSYKNFEFIIIDDFSSDTTFKILKSYEKKDNRLKIHRNFKILGPAKTRNKAVNLAKGKWISVIDADDVFFPKKIEKQISLVNKNKNLIFVGTSLLFIDTDGAYIAYYKYKNDSKKIKKEILKNKSFPPHSSYFFKKSFFLKLGGYNERYLMAPDYDLLLRLQSFKEKEFAVCEEVLTKVRLHKENRSLKTINNFTQLDFAITASTCFAIEKKFKINPSRDFDNLTWKIFMSFFKNYILKINYYNFLVNKLKFKKNKKINEYLIYVTNFNFLRSFFIGHVLPLKFQENFFKIFEKKFIKSNNNLKT